MAITRAPDYKDLAFVYKWIDTKNNMYYIGSHKGSPDDGYICSSKYMLEEYNKRPDDFYREILVIGEYPYIRDLEEKLLKLVNAALNEQYYKKSNGDGKFYCIKHSEETKKKMRGHPNYLKNHTEETKRKISKNSIGHPNYLKNHTEETRKKISESMKKLIRKKYIVITPHGVKIYPNSLRQYALENNLQYQNLWKVSKGLRNNTRGYKCKELL